jgi:hypothetical protein
MIDSFLASCSALGEVVFLQGLASRIYHSRSGDHLSTAWSFIKVLGVLTLRLEEVLLRFPRGHVIDLSLQIDIVLHLVLVLILLIELLLGLLLGQLAWTDGAESVLLLIPRYSIWVDH